MACFDVVGLQAADREIKLGQKREVIAEVLRGYRLLDFGRYISCPFCAAYGPSGPLADAIGFDGTDQALSRAMSLTGTPDQPFRSAVSYVDYSTAISAALGTVAASPGVLRITLKRPERLNALDHDGHRELAYVWNKIDQDPEVSAVILRGAERAFSAGGDFSVVKDLIADDDARVRMFKEARDLVYTIINCSKPMVSAIHGAAVGAGLIAALLADILVASKTAKIVDGNTRIGVAAGDHAPIIWPLPCGMAKAKYHLMLCAPISGEQAEQMGLVSLAVDEDALEGKTLDIAHRLAAGAPNAIRLTKYALNNWLRIAGPAFADSLALQTRGLGGPEAREQLASFQEKRPPSFSQKSPL